MRSSFQCKINAATRNQIKKILQIILQKLDDEGTYSTPCGEGQRFEKVYYNWSLDPPDTYEVNNES